MCKRERDKRVSGVRAHAYVCVRIPVCGAVVPVGVALCVREQLQRVHAALAAHVASVRAARTCARSGAAHVAAHSHTLTRRHNVPYLPTSCYCTIFFI